MERRTFIKTSCRICLLGAAGLMMPGLVNLAAAKDKVYKTKVNDKNQLEIPVSLFADTNLQIIRVKGWDYDVALHKREDGTFAAILMKCTHMDNQITLTGEGFQCSMHGSRFDTEGKVLNGPAEVPLIQYKAILNQEIITISE
ncbi:ubiquinol-cytochrome c reductase iron-sulfur subunit [Chitinophagaceae bacterium MMS25-I14]